MAITVPMDTAEATPAAQPLDLCFRLSTPCFASGAAPAMPEVRLPAIMGMIRKWWRATEVELFELAPGDILALRKKEFALFGAAASDGGGGQGAFLATLAGETPPTAATRGLNDHVRRLAGRAVDERRSYIAAHVNEKHFHLSFRFKRRADAALRQDLMRAADLWLALGGLGLCSRRGFGSCDRAAGGTLELEEIFWKRTIVHLPTQHPRARCQSFPLFSKNARIWSRRLPPKTRGEDALRSHACDLSEFAAELSPAPPIDAVFADPVSDHEKRLPSPVHTHVAVLAEATVIICTYLPTLQTSNLLHCHVHRFFKNSDFQLVWPPFGSAS